MNDAHMEKSITQKLNPAKRNLSYAALMFWIFGYGGLAVAADGAAGPELMPAKAAICKHTAASLRCTDGLVEGINNTGNVDLKGTVVSGDAVVAGSFKAKDAKLNTIQVAGWTNIGSSVVAGPATITGSSKLHDSQFDEPVHVTGNLNSAHDTFASDLTVTGNLKVEGSEVRGVLTTASKEAHFTGSQINKLEIKPAGGAKSKQVVYLQDHTVVASDINFVSGRGAVFVGTGSAVNGKVIGGEVLQATG